MYKACPTPTHFTWTKFRVDEVSRGLVEPFRALIQSDPFRSSLNSSSVQSWGHESLDGIVGCHYVTIVVLISVLVFWDVHSLEFPSGVCLSFSLALLFTRLGVTRVVSTYCIVQQMGCGSVYHWSTRTSTNGTCRNGIGSWHVVLTSSSIRAFDDPRWLFGMFLTDAVELVSSRKVLQTTRETSLFDFFLFHRADEDDIIDRNLLTKCRKSRCIFTIVLE